MGHESTAAEIVLSRKKIPHRSFRSELRSRCVAPADALSTSMGVFVHSGATPPQIPTQIPPPRLS